MLLSFVIVGAPLAGSETLAGILNRNPALFFPDGPSGLFLQPEFGEKEFEEYKKRYRFADMHQMIGDYNKAYFDVYSDINTAARFKKHFQDLKIILTLRHPIQRAWAMMMDEIENDPKWIKATENQKAKKFEKTIREEMEGQDLPKGHPRLLYKNKYSHHVAPWVLMFGANNVRIVLFEQWKNDISGVINDLERWIDVRTQNLEQKDLLFTMDSNGRMHKSPYQLPSFLRSFNLLWKMEKALHNYAVKKQKAAAVAAPKIKLRKELRQDLLAYFKKDVMELEKITGRNDLLKTWKL